jgi:cytochrome b6-f complex iron-sulfur subunit
VISSEKQKGGIGNQAGEISPDVSSRRSFINRLWGLFGIIALAQLTWLVFSYLWPRRKQNTGEESIMIAAGPADAFSTGSVTAFVKGKFYLCRLEDGGFMALSRQCTHLGCTVPWDDEKKLFICPCHSSIFDIRGNVVRSPAPRALDTYAVSIINNRVMVDTGAVSKRSGNKSAQVVYPK